MKCPNCPKPSGVNLGTLAVPRGVPAHMGHFLKVMYSKYNKLEKVSHCPTALRVGQLGHSATASGSIHLRTLR